MIEPDYPKQALWDFALQFVTPTARRYLNDPAAGVALELGSTDGLRAEAAASFFRRVIAVDVAAMHEIKLPGSTRSPNVELVARDSAQIPVESSSIDFVFTLRGLTWFSSIDAFDNELGEVVQVEERIEPDAVSALLDTGLVVDCEVEPKLTVGESGHVDRDAGGHRGSPAW